MLHLDEHIAQKKAIYMRYKEAFKDLPVKMNPYLQCSEPNFWLSCLTINDGEKIMPEDIRLVLAKENIESAQYGNRCICSLYIKTMIL